jgi:hypothetical protein
MGAYATQQPLKSVDRVGQMLPRNRSLRHRKTFSIDACSPGPALNHQTAPLQGG